jgi:hypothetical protein
MRKSTAAKETDEKRVEDKMPEKYANAGSMALVAC